MQSRSGTRRLVKVDRHRTISLGMIIIFHMPIVAGINWILLLENVGSRAHMETMQEFGEVRDSHLIIIDSYTD